MKIKLLSFLGTGDYKPAYYTYETDTVHFITDEATPYSQKAIYQLVQHLKKNDESIETIDLYLALTTFAKERNYINNANEPDQIGLCMFEDALSIHPFDIHDGKSEAELWENFGIIFDQLEDGDLVYLDITHAFRSLPLIATAILDYAVTLKDIQIGGVFYCAYDAREEKTGQTTIPIFDLTSFVTLSSMSFGANTLIKKGDASFFETSLKLVLTPIPAGKGEGFLINKLKKLPKLYTSFFVALNTSDLFTLNRCLVDIRTCLSEIQALKEQMFIPDNTGHQHPELLPYIKLIEKTAHLFDQFDVLGKKDKKDKAFSNKETKKSFIDNTDQLIAMALDYRLYQQAATMFIENLISRVVYQLNGSLFNKELRDKANKFLYANRPVQFGSKNTEGQEEYFPELKSIPQNKHLGLYKDKVGDIRNSMNHANMNESSGNKTINTQRLIDLFNEYLEAMEEFE